MAKIKIITDGTSSLTLEEIKKLDIECVEMSYVLDGEEHYAFDDEGTSLPEFYEKIDAAKSISTGCVNPQTFEDLFEKYAAKGTEMIYIGLSAALSATSSNAETAAANIEKKYGKKLVYIVDTRQVGGSYGLYALIELAKDYIAEGKSASEVVELLNTKANNGSFAFVARDLNFLHKCGRLSAVGAMIGKMLKVVPLIYADAETGKFKVGDKCLGTKLAHKTLKNKFIKLIAERGFTKAYITSCALDSEAEDLKNYILENTTGVEVKVGYIDKVLSCCCGPKTLAIFCV